MLQIQVVRVGIEPGITVLQIQLVVRVGIEPGITVLQIQLVVRVGIEPGITVTNPTGGQGGN